MSVAERTRAAVYDEPFLLDALRAGVVNYSAAARHLPVDGDEESIATALRRFADELEAEVEPDRRASVRLRRGVGVIGRGDADADASDADLDARDRDALLTVGDAALVDDGDLAAVHARGDVDPRALEAVLGRLRGADVAVETAAVGGEDLLVAVERRAGPDALRLVEDALE